MKRVAARCRDADLKTESRLAPTIVLPTLAKEKEGGRGGGPNEEVTSLRRRRSEAAFGRVSARSTSSS